MRALLLFVIFWIYSPSWADVQLLSIAYGEPISMTELAGPVIKTVNAAPDSEPVFDTGFRLTIDGVRYYIKPSMFMAKSTPDEICHPIIKSLTYKCEEGQAHVYGCHLLFFNAGGEWVGFKTLNINEKQYPHFCNAMPAIGVADKDKNELLVTMQYFLADGGGAKKVSDLGSDWFRMTTLFRVQAVNGKIEVVQDDACLGNPNQVDTIAKARKQLQRCAAHLK